MDGWRSQKLREVFKLEYGKPLPSERRSDDGEFPVYGANGVKCRTNDVYWNKPSIVVGRKGSAGEVNLVDGGFWPLDVTYFVVFDESEYDLKFLHYLLSWLNLPSLAKGVKPGLNRNDVYAIEQCFPPLPEQERIVAILDEAFAAIATATANAEKNLANARELFQSHVNTTFTQQGEGWVGTTLGAEIDLLPGFAFKSTGYTESDDSIRLLRGDNVVQGGLRWKNAKRWPTSDVGEYAKYHLSDRDVVLAMDRTWVKAGLKYASISSGDLPCLLVQRVARLRSGPGLDSRFLAHFVGSATFTRYVLSIQTGIGVPHISGQQIKDCALQRPSVAEQRAISEVIDRLCSKTQQLEAIHEREIRLLAELKQSILHKAFTGELTAAPKAADRKLSEAGV